MATHTRMHVHTHTHTHRYSYTYMHTCTCIHTHIHSYTYMHTHTCTYTQLWDLNADDRFEEGICQKVIADLDGPIKVNSHGELVVEHVVMRSNPPTQCLVQLSHDMICSGGKDICLWDRNGRLLSKFDRSQLEESSEGGNGTSCRLPRS